MSGEARSENSAMRWLRVMGAQIVETYRKGVSIAWLAPALFAIVAVAEFAQHVYEIRIGLHAADPVIPGGDTLATLWIFAYVKVAALLIGIALSFHFWMQGANVARVLRFRLRDLGKVALGLLIFAALDWATRAGQALFLSLGLDPDAATNADIFWDTILVVAQILLLPWFLAALGGEDGMGLWRSARAAARHFVRLLVLLALAFAPAALLHQLIHLAARGADPVPLWALMIADSFVVGLLATLVGSALYVFHRRAADATPA